MTEPRPATELATEGDKRRRTESTAEEPIEKRQRSDSCPDSCPDAQPPPPLPSDSELARMPPSASLLHSPVRVSIWAPAPVSLRQQLEAALKRVLHRHGGTLQTWTITYTGEDGQGQCCASSTSF